MINTNHYVITRLAIKFGSYEVNHSWVDHRLPLFEKITYPSMMNQSCKNFKWFLLCYESMLNENNKKRVLSYEDDICKPIIKNSYRECMKECINIIKKENSKYVISTRLDNDDAYAKNYIELIQNLEPNRFPFLIISNKGYSLSNNIIRELNFGNSPPFLSLIEELTDKLVTINSGSHGQMFNRYSNHIFLEDRVTLQLIHDSNASNREQKGNIIDINLEDKFGFNSKKLCEWLKNNKSKVKPKRTIKK